MRLSLEFGASAWEWGLALAALAATAWHLRRSTAAVPLRVLRGCGALALALALLRPAVARRDPVLVKPKLVVIVDASHSMGGKGLAAKTRLEAATQWLLDRRAELEKRAEVSLYAADGGARRLVSWDELKTLKPADSALNAGEALKEAAEDPGTAGASRAWLLTDGNAEPTSDAESGLAALKAPVDVLGVGPTRRERGVSFAELKTPDFAFLHGRFEVQASVDASDLAGQAVRLRLLREQPGLGFTQVDEKMITPASDYEAVTATFTAQAQRLGAERYRLEASAGAGAARSRDFRVEVIRQKYRIMYLSGRPSPEYAQLREFLKSDPNHELVSFVILRNPDNPSYVSDNELSLIPFPAEEIFVQNLNQFDLFILENFSYARFRLPAAYLESLKRFVSEGGGLLVIGGENAFGSGGYRGSPVEDMLPVTLAGTAPDFQAGLFQAKPTARTHPLVRLYDTPEASEQAWKELPPLDGFARFASVKPGATVLAVQPDQRTSDGQPLPVFAIRDYGRGKVMLASSDSTWRWKLGAAADWRIGAFYARFWTKAVQYLTGSLDLSKVKFAPLPDRLPPREPAQFSLRVFDESFKPAERQAVELNILWTTPDGKTREVTAQPGEPGVYSIELTGLKPGAHKLRAVARYQGRPWGEDSVRFQWEAAAADAPMDRRWIHRAAEAAGGQALELAGADAGALLKALPPVREQAEVKRRRHPSASGWWLLLAGGLLLSEWALRRRRGLA